MSTADGLFWRQEVVRAALTIPTILTEYGEAWYHASLGDLRPRVRIPIL